MSDMDRLFKYSKYKGYKNRTVPKLHENETIANTELDVSYTFNEYGFRTKPWCRHNTEECYVALGCSNTLGMGMPEELRWSNLLETHTGVTVYNLGICNGSADTVTRLATGWFPEIKPTKVFVLWPPLVRWEIATKNKIITISPTTLNERNFTEKQNKIHYASMDEEFNFEVNSLRNKHTLKVICDNLNIELYTLDFDTCRHIDKNGARDGKHNGPVYQRAIADEFINLLDK